MSRVVVTSESEQATADLGASLARSLAAWAIVI